MYRHGLKEFPPQEHEMRPSWMHHNIWGFFGQKRRKRLKAILLSFVDHAETNIMPSIGSELELVCFWLAVTVGASSLITVAEKQTRKPCCGCGLWILDRTSLVIWWSRRTLLWCYLCLLLRPSLAQGPACACSWAIQCAWGGVVAAGSEWKHLPPSNWTVSCRCRCRVPPYTRRPDGPACMHARPALAHAPCFRAGACMHACVTAFIYRNSPVCPAVSLSLSRILSRSGSTCRRYN